MLSRLLAGWEEAADSSWFDELQLALGRQQLHLLPLLIQTVQLRRAAGGPVAGGPGVGQRSNTR